jgi:hypothetical protein
MEPPAEKDRGGTGQQDALDQEGRLQGEGDLEAA